MNEDFTLLWTDDIFVTSDDLAMIDSEIPGVAVEESLTLDGVQGFIRRQIDECGEVILQRQQIYGGWVGSSTLSANHISAVLNIGGGAAAARTRIILNQVVVSDRIPDKWSHLKRWVCYRIVCAFYRNVYSRVASKDRFKSKLTEFNRELKRTQEQTLDDLGLPICYQPLPMPGALFEIDPGTWGSTNLSLVAGPGTLAATYDVVVTYASSQFYKNSLSLASRGNAESQPSQASQILLANGTVLEVDISTLIPPDGVQDPGTIAMVVYTPLRATHWNVYAGSAGTALHLQNAAPIPIATKTFTLPGDPLSVGPQPGTGQYPDRRYQFQKVLQRA